MAFVDEQVEEKQEGENEEHGDRTKAALEEGHGHSITLAMV